MTNPWLKRNPALSLWLSGFNMAANAARSATALQMQRQMQAMMLESTQAMLRFWTRAALPTTPAARRSRSRRK